MMIDFGKIVYLYRVNITLIANSFFVNDVLVKKDLDTPRFL